MPNRNAPANGTKYTGWFRDNINNVLELYYNGTKVAQASASAFTVTGALSSPSTISSTTTMTAGTGLTVTTGNSVVTAGDARITAGNVRLGAVETFGTTEPTSAVVMKAGTAPAGAITTSGGVFASATVVRKIIAAGTVSNVET
jgi:lipopolysaccharide export system protein LptA